MTNLETLPYGAWRSPITSELIVGEALGLGEIRVDGGDIYWIEGRPSEGGRNVLVRRAPDGQIADLTPAPFSVRSRVHEYGGGAMTLHRGFVYFTNFSDQRLYQQAGGMPPTPLTPPPDPAQGGIRWRYADGLIDAARQRWIGVREEHGEGRVDNTLVAIDLAAPGPGQVLAEGDDFYASGALSPDATCLAWLCWNHPNMPWVGNRLWLAQIAEDGRLMAPRLVAGGDSESIFQPQWSPDGGLYFVSDRSGWWNLYRCDPQGDGGVQPLCPRAAEFGQAQWNFGQSTYAFLSADQLVCAYSEAGQDRLARLDIAAQKLMPRDLPYSDFGQVRGSGEHIVCRAGSPGAPSATVLIDPAHVRPGAYRDRLKGAWGVVDVDDCVNAVRHAIAEGLADGERAVITGGSAGGYTVLAALACRDVFKGGASYYGVSDVAALARDTHKFESRYLDWLIGPYPERADLYRERSPLTHADRLSRPVIFFQGEDDRVVPPNQTEMLVEALRRQGIPCGYSLCAWGRHVSRRADNIKRALDAELYFYSTLIFRTRLSF